MELPAAARDEALRRAGSGETLVDPAGRRRRRPGGDRRRAPACASGSASAARPTAGAVTTHLVGQGALWARMQEIAKHDVKSAEKKGFPIVALILLAVFGSAAAAALPLALGFASVLLTGGLIYALSMAMDMSVFVTNMASMIGIGVAVDYSLFVLARYREEIAAGKAPEIARSTAMATSGMAVIFSGVTVIASLAGLFLIDATAIRSMAIGAILVVAVAIVASATLLPALISKLGHRRGRAGRCSGACATAPGPATGSGAAGRASSCGGRSSRSLAATAVLLALAAPALNLETTNGALRQFDPQDETRQGFEAATAVTGPGASAPVRVVAQTARPRRRPASIRRTIAR